jgi:hypothetical protein
VTDITEVKCGTCKVPLKGPVDAKADDRFTCPEGGNGDTYENVLREVGEYVKEQTAQHLERQMADIARWNKMFQFTPASRPQQSYRFIVDLNLH